MSGYLGVAASSDAPPSLHLGVDDSWLVGFGSNDALFALRLDMSERIFSSSFDSVP